MERYLVCFINVKQRGDSLSKPTYNLSFDDFIEFSHKGTAIMVSKKLTEKGINNIVIDTEDLLKKKEESGYTNGEIINIDGLTTVHKKAGEYIFDYETFKDLSKYILEEMKKETKKIPAISIGGESSNILERALVKLKDDIKTQEKECQGCNCDNRKI